MRRDDLEQQRAGVDASLRSLERLLAAIDQNLPDDVMGDLARRRHAVTHPACAIVNDFKKITTKTVRTATDLGKGAACRE